MHLILPQDQLLKAIDLVAKVADKNHRYAILANIRFELTQETLTLTASDLEVELTTTLKLPEGACLATGSTTIIASKLHEIFKSLPAGVPTEMSVNQEGRCTICAGKSKFTLTTLPAQDFPSIGTPTNQKSASIAQNDLSQMIHKTRFAMAAQDVRYYLTGMLFHIENTQITSVATDGHRLAVAHRVLTNDYGEDAQIIVPGKAVTELERLLNELGKTLTGDDVVQLLIDGEFLQVTLNFGKPDDNGLASDEIAVSMTARLIEGKFPDYRRVLPTSNDRTVLVEKDAIMDLLRRVSILSNEKLRGVIFEFGDSNTATVRSNNPEATAQGEATETLAVTYTGEPIEVSMNELYLKAVFNVLSGTLSIQMSHPSSPALIKQVGDERHQFVVMPMRI